jgi:hypothetical protein
MDQVYVVLLRRRNDPSGADNILVSTEVDYQWLVFQRAPPMAMKASIDNFAAGTAIRRSFGMCFVGLILRTQRS